MYSCFLFSQSTLYRTDFNRAFYVTNSWDDTL